MFRLFKIFRNLESSGLSIQYLLTEVKLVAIYNSMRKQDADVGGWFCKRGHVFKPKRAVWEEQKSPMLDNKDFEALNTLFAFVGAFVDRATGQERAYIIPQVLTMFVELKRWQRWKDRQDILSDSLLRSVIVEAQSSRRLQMKCLMWTEMMSCLL